MSDSYQSQTVVPADHAALSGHFPGNPVVPGVVILESVAETLRAWQPTVEIIEFPAVKFHQIIRPEQPFDIRLHQQKEGRYRFECDAAGQLIASGSFICRAVNVTS